MKVNVAVCGKFHYHNYISYIDQSGLLGRFYYAHRRSTDAQSLGVDPQHAVNLWIKEYLVHGHNRLLGPRLDWLGSPVYHKLWQYLVLLNWRTCDLFHFMLHGTCLKILDRARSEKSVILGEPVNSHPVFFTRLLNEEHERLGLTERLEIGSLRPRLRETEACDYLVAGSELIRRSFVENGFNADRAFVIPYGVDLRYFYPLTADERRNADDGKFRVICVAQITPRKGQIYLLEAWRNLNLPNAELLLIGQIHESMHPILRKFEGTFRHIPHVPNRELRQYYGRSSVFVLPSIEDGFAYVCTEAMGCGLPVITTTNTGAAGVIEDGKQGFIVPIRSPDAIAEKLEILHRDPGLRKSMGDAAHEKSKESFGWDRYAKALIDLYSRITPGSPKSPPEPAPRTH